jgi:hypothetical protein
MKTFLFALGVLTLGGCFSASETQVEVTNAELVKIDTVLRYDDNSKADHSWLQEQRLTWRDDYNDTYVCFASLDQTYVVGTRMTVLRKK